MFPRPHLRRTRRAGVLALRGGPDLVLHRQPNGEYATASESLAFPDLPMSEFNRFLTILR